jgi:hypothetical protein
MSSLGILLLPEANEVNSTDLFLVQQNNTTNQISFNNLLFDIENASFAPILSANNTFINQLSTTLYSISAQENYYNNYLTNLVTNTINTTFSALSLAMYPVSSIKCTYDGVNPQTYFTGTTWSLVLSSQGYFLAGVGTTSQNGGFYNKGDRNSTNLTFNVGADTTYGEYVHQVTQNEMPVHVHNFSIRLNNTGTSSSFQNGPQTPPAWRLDNPTTYFTSANTTIFSPHNNIPPLYGVYVWIRTS